MEKIKKFFECLLPVTACNLKCEYCYIIQRDNRSLQVPKLDYSPEVIGEALTKERLGGVCYFSICGAGETFVPDYLIDIVYQILNNGHYVNITTNGTLTNKMKRLESLPREFLKRLHISFSFHYLELKRFNLMDDFFENVSFVKSLGCSYLVQINLYDNYLPHLEEIKALCLEKTGALPQVAATRKEEDITKKIELLTEKSVEEYTNIGLSFDSPLFDYTMRNFNVKRKEFCYAGAWSFVLNLKTGVLKRCYSSSIHQNIFKNTKKPIMNLPVGKKCNSLYCLNSSHFMSLGVIPELQSPTYAFLRNRKNANWYSEEMDSFLDGKLCENNKQCSKAKKLYCNFVGVIDKCVYKSYQILKKKRNNK